MIRNIVLTFITFVFCIQLSYSQCTPIDCAASLPAYGGLCDEFLAQGLANTAYSDSESFILTDNCFDAGLFDPSLAGTNIRITNIDNITFGNLPNGLSAASNQLTYSPPAGSYIAGCAAFTGTPTEAGVFEASIDFLADVSVCPFNIPIADQAAGFPIEITILPDPNFSGLTTSYCTDDTAVTLTTTGTMGGTFTGPGIIGNTFDPAIAGVGMHTITYTVSAQEGTAIAPATNAMDMVVTVSMSTTYYADTDNDQYGDPNNSIQSCNPPLGYVLDNTDCDDTNMNINPGAADIPNNGIDEDCMNGDETTVIDNDNDGYDISVDCNDDNPNVNPGATEVCNGKDDDCNGLIDDGLTEYTYYVDIDGDGFGDPDSMIVDCSDTPPMGYSSNADDCDDDSDLIYLGAPELCDGLDNDCNGIPDDVAEPFIYYADLDGDGYTDNNNILDTCASIAPMGYSASPSQFNDCDDNNPNINPGATEICDEIDNNCSGTADDGLTEYTYYLDSDSDTYGDNANSIVTCESPAPNGYVEDNTDCNDANPDINPGASEICDGIDNNCNGTADDGLPEYTYYLDSDSDNFGDIDNSIVTCESPAPNGYVEDNTDCDDTNPNINPNATDIPDNGIDEDCQDGDLVDIQNIETTFGIKMTPNPASDILYLNSTQNIEVNIEIFSILGIRTYTTATMLNGNYSIDISTLDSGFYFLKITDNTNRVGIQKFIVEK